MADPPQEKAIAWLVASFSVVTALIAAVGAAPGSVVDRVLKNDPIPIFVAFVLAIASVAVAVFAYASHDELRMHLTRISLFLFAAGILTLTYLLTASRIDQERPIVRGSLKVGSGMTLEVTAKASGLKADDQVYVYAWGRRVTTIDAQGEPESFERDLLYTSQTGPDRAGVVDLSFEVPIPVGRYTAIGVSPALNGAPQPCDVTLEPTPPARNQGCLVIRVPYTSPRPILSGRLTSNDSHITVLHVDIAADTLGAGQTVLVRAVGIKTGRKLPIPLYNAVIGPNGTGQVNTSLEVPVDQRVSVVCVEAAPLGLVVRAPRPLSQPGALPCPPRISSVSARMRIPVQ